jgi:hypothetical protein
MPSQKEAIVMHPLCHIIGKDSVTGKIHGGWAQQPRCTGEFSGGDNVEQLKDDTVMN